MCAPFRFGRWPGPYVMSTSSRWTVCGRTSNRQGLTGQPPSAFTSSSRVTNAASIRQRATVSGNRTFGSACPRVETKNRKPKHAKPRHSGRASGVRHKTWSRTSKQASGGQTARGRTPRVHRDARRGMGRHNSRHVYHQSWKQPPHALRCDVRTHRISTLCAGGMTRIHCSGGALILILRAVCVESGGRTRVLY
ncbi:hypothetical protein DAEQUDRAFT_475513 [Daedalea quercina L-15889]|uniref:Uncharacterized protein n=1 Tax=Daedalea quercina L-15889 TaxID=1314783 RepID=A0A165MXN0_9APHY|nr:hypothetical protein DAEQUDRAFT_475513 [Daedalea quercina L-15889]